MNTTNMHGHLVLCDRKRSKPYGIDWDCEASYKKPKLKTAESDRAQFVKEPSENNEDKYTVFSLPREIYSLILHQLSKNDLTSIELVCKSWQLHCWKVFNTFTLEKLSDRLFKVWMPKLNKTDLIRLSIHATPNLTDQSFAALFEFKNLQELEIINAPSLSSSSFSAIGIQFPKLRVLRINNCHNLTNQSLETFNNLTNLKALSLCDCSGLSNDGLRNLTNLTKLKSLDLARCYKLNFSGLSILKDLTDLELLDMSYCNCVNKRKRISKMFPKLQYVYTYSP
jgi:hypothetical protein